MNSGASISSGTGFGQFFADQGPRYDSGRRTRTVLSRRAGVYRPDKRKKKIKWL